MTGSRAERLSGLVPRGSSVVGVGLVLLGVGSYAYLAMAGHTLTPGPYSALSVLWVLLFTVGPGIFLPLEQEIGRVVASHRAVGASYLTVVARAAGLVGVGVVVCTVALTAAGPQIDRLLFTGDASGRWCLVGGLWALALVSLLRGVAAGRGLFGRYSLQLAADGVLRLLLGAVLLVTGTSDLWAWGAILTLAPLLSGILAVVRWPHDAEATQQGVVVSGLGLSHALGALMVATFSSQVLANGAVAVAQLSRSEHQPAVVGALLVGLIVARAPLFLYAAVQASLLPRLAAARAERDGEAFVRLLRSTAVVVTAVGAVNVAAVAVAAAWAVRTLFGVESLDRSILVLLAGGTVFYLIAQVLAQGVLALEGHVQAALAWLVGVGVFGVAFWLLGGSLDARVAWAYCAGSVTVCLVTPLLVRQRLAEWRRHTAQGERQ